MKKTLIYLFSGLLLFATPSMVQAEESDQSVIFSDENQDSTLSAQLDLHKTTEYFVGLGNLPDKDSLSTSAVIENQNETTAEIKQGAEQGVLQIVAQELIYETTAPLQEVLHQSNDIITNSVSNVVTIPEEKTLVEVQLSQSPLLGDVNVELLSNTKDTTPDGYTQASGLVTVDVNNPLVNTHIGVLEESIEHHLIETDEGTTITGGIVNIDIENPTVGNVHVGIGDYDHSSDEVASPTPSNPGDSTAPDNNTDHHSENNNGTNSGSQTGDNSENQSGNNSGIDGRDEAEVDAAELVSPTEEAQNSHHKDHILTKDQHLDISERMNSSVGQFLKTMLDAGNNTVLNQPESVYIQFTSELNKLNEVGANSAGITTTSAPTNSSSSPSSSSTSLSSGSGTSVVLSLGYNHEVSLKKQTQTILKTLSTQWTDSPPVQPPISSFTFIK